MLESGAHVRCYIQTEGRWGVALSGHCVSEYLHFHFLPSNKSVDVDFRYMENWPQFHHLDMQQISAQIQMIRRYLESACRRTCAGRGGAEAGPGLELGGTQRTEDTVTRPGTRPRMRGRPPRLRTPRHRDQCCKRLIGDVVQSRRRPLLVYQGLLQVESGYYCFHI